MTKNQIIKSLRELLTTQQFAVIATTDRHQPYTSLVAFTITPDFQNLIFATLRDTQKYVNLRTNSSLAALVDNRDNLATDINHAIAVTIVGKAQDRTTPELKDIHRKKHPYLEEFLQNKDCALIQLKIKTYIMVNEFQHITLLAPDEILTKNS